MNNSDKPAPKKPSGNLLQTASVFFIRYSAVLFAVLLLGLYGYIAFRIFVAQTASPSDGEINSQLQAATTPHIDPKAVQQMQSLQDHSVNVRTLFDQARSNPFGE